MYLAGLLSVAATTRMIVRQMRSPDGAVILARDRSMPDRPCSMNLPLPCQIGRPSPSDRRSRSRCPARDRRPC
eukprot:12528244-Heterocapsa_arctica.AAC.1